MAGTINVKVYGLEELKRKIEQFPRETEKLLGYAGKEAADKVILPTKGLQKYPGATAANSPPTPYYIRGRGTQRAGRIKPEYNDMRSENLGKQWVVKRQGYGAEISNPVSYAHWVHGEDQASFMAPKGWRKLTGPCVATGRALGKHRGVLRRRA